MAIIHGDVPNDILRGLGGMTVTARDELEKKTTKTKIPFLCRGGLLGLEIHQWIYLKPFRRQLEEMCLLLTEGEGALGAVEAGPEHVQDRVCRMCFRHESRFEKFLEALRKARGM